MDYAVKYLKTQNAVITQTPEEATHLLLPVPSFDPDGHIKGGGSLTALLAELPKTITVLGGNLDRPELAGYNTVDFLKDPLYLAQNAKITAHCAIKLAMSRLPVILQDCRVLVIGWGRIGKCLAVLLRQLGAKVTVSARKETDRAMLNALGYKAVNTAQLDGKPFHLIFNTVPAAIPAAEFGDAVKIDLASVPGLEDPDVIRARGLPSKEAPESSGKLIARTAIRIAVGKENDT